MENLNRIELRGVVGAVNVAKVCSARVCRFSVATNYAYRDRNNGPVIETTWHQVVEWEKDGNFVEPKKGDNVEVNGRVRTQKYTDSEGNEHTAYEVIANGVKVL